MAGTTTVLPFNPGQTNQESDATYLADSNRSGGFGTDAIWPSVLANKTLNQLSNYLYALFTAFAQKGFTTNDDNVPLLISICSNFLTSADILPAIASVAYSPTPSFNAGAANGFQMSLAGNVTSSTISGVTPGQLIAFYFTQDATGGRTVVFPSSFVGGLQPDPTANSVSLQMFRADLAGNPRAVTPMVSANGTFMGALKASSFTLNSPGTAGQVLTNVGGLFVPAAIPVGMLTRYDVTSTRSFGTTYTNSYGKPLTVTGYGLTHGSSVGSIQCFVGGSHDFANTVGATVDGGACGFSFVVPAGSTYQIAQNTLSGGGNNAVYAVGAWIETVTT